MSTTTPNFVSSFSLACCWFLCLSRKVYQYTQEHLQNSVNQSNTSFPGTNHCNGNRRKNVCFNALRKRPLHDREVEEEDDEDADGFEDEYLELASGRCTWRVVEDITSWALSSHPRRSTPGVFTRTAAAAGAQDT